VEGASASGLGKFQQQQRPHQQTLASDLRDIRQEQLNLQRRFGFSMASTTACRRSIKAEIQNAKFKIHGRQPIQYSLRAIVGGAPVGERQFVSLDCVSCISWLILIAQLALSLGKFRISWDG